MTINILGIVDFVEDNKVECHKCKRRLDRKQFYESKVAIRLCKNCSDMYNMKYGLRKMLYRINRTNWTIKESGGKVWMNPIEDVKQLIDTHE